MSSSLSSHSQNAKRMDILEEIVAYKRVEVEGQKEQKPATLLYKEVERAIDEHRHDVVSMRRSLADSNTGIIAEFKRKSPSKGWIHEDARVEDVVPRYVEAGASALSILTDEQYFGGNMRFIEQVRPMVQTPILRKDFIVDEYQLFQARLIGADAVLLIAADLKRKECDALAAIAHELGLETLLEIHSEHELDYVGEHIDMVGVNNRNLGTFHTDVQNSFRLASLLPKEFLLVSESGIGNPSVVRDLRMAGYRGFLIGETFMKTTNPAAALKSFIEDIER